MQIIYFAWVRERVGKAEEHMQLPGGIETVSDLLDHLISINEVYQAALADKSALRVAVNQEHVGLDHKITDADEVAFFPPVTGG